MRFSILWTPVLAAGMAVTAFGHSFGADPGYSGAPGDSTCVACHGGSPNTGPGSVKIAFANNMNTYIPGQTLRVTVTVSDPNQKRWGFEASPRLSSDPQNQGAGTLTPVDGNTRITGTSGTLQWITHTSAGTRNGTSGGASFDFDWAPPSSDVGEVTFYVAGNAANGNGAPTGDLIYTTTAKLTAAAAQVGNKPSIRQQNGIVNGASLQPGLVAGSWFTVFGSFGGGSGRIWRGDEIQNGKLPTSLDGISVTVNGKPAAVYYISDGQINAQAPDDDSTGTVNVVVTTPGGTSDPMTATLVQSAPGLFLFDPLGRKYPAAVALDGSYLGPAGMFGSALATRPAKPGETILLFGTGFGKTNPAVASGTVFSGAAPLVDNVHATIGGADATVSFSGLSGAGLYQFNVVVPSGTPDGDQPLVLSIDGQNTQGNVVLAVQR